MKESQRMLGVKEQRTSAYRREDKGHERRRGEDAVMKRRVLM